MGASEKPGEFELVSRFLAPLAASEPGAFGLSDDAALLTPEEGHRLIVTTDTLVAGVHFLTTDDPSSVAAKLLGVNLSDLAAMGASPWTYTLSMALSEDWEVNWVEAFAEGLGREQERHGMVLVGGDTVTTPGPLTLTLTALGTVAEGRELRRTGARTDDDVYVSGAIGDAALGLKVLQGGIGGLPQAEAETLVARYHRPEPRVRLGQRLAGLAGGVIDVSDGLVADLGHVARASAKGAVIEAERVPLSDAARAAIAVDPELRDLAITGGDDYELLFTAPPSAAAAVDELAEELALPLTAIGRITEADDDAGEVRVVDGNGRPLPLKKGGYSHF